MKKQKGITLIALVITTIVLLILAGVTIATLTGDNGLLTKAGEAKNTNEKGEIEEQIKLAYNEWKLQKETDENLELKDIVETNLIEKYDEVNVNKQGKAISIKVKNHEFTLADDGTMEEGQLAYLDIAEGNIDLYSNGYKQYTGSVQAINKNNVTEYTGKYIITGTTTEHVVRVCDIGSYDITIKNLNIDVSKNNLNAFNVNEGKKEIGCYVNLTVDGNNYLIGGNLAGLAAGGGKPNIEGITNGSSLTVDGNGSLVAKGNHVGPYGAVGIGGITTKEGCVSNITINSGNITAIASNGNASGFGAGLYGDVNNIIINGGNINATGSGIGPGIGATYGKADNIIINGGNITATGKLYRASIDAPGSGKIQINGGNITCYHVQDGYHSIGTLGGHCGQLVITGGTIKTTCTRKNTNNAKFSAISCEEGGNIQVKGGNIFTDGGYYDIASRSSSNGLDEYIPTDGTNNLYKTLIKLQDIEENKQVTKLTTSDKIEYGINDMYTLENGMLYLYLPTGTRTITIEVDGKTYLGSVQTTETPVEITLNEIN